MMLRGRSREERKKRIAEQASLWLERLERTLRENEAKAFRLWLKEPLHREIIVERCTLWHGMEVLAILGTLIPDDVALSRLPPKSGGFGTTLAWIVATCVVGFSTYVFIGGSPTTAFKVNKETLRIQGPYRAPSDERRQVDLPDGTKITLNTASSIFVNYGLKTRDVALVRGEALFDVPRTVRAFSVSVEGRTIETERARFNLRSLGNGQSEITVIEGTVRLLRPRVSARKTPAQLRDPISYSYGGATLNAADAGVLAMEWQILSELTKSEAQARLAWADRVATR